MEAVVVMAQCSRTKGYFGIRTQKCDGYWAMTWAFKLSSQRAAAEGYDRQTVSGTILLTDTYPGCPYCGDTAWVKCARCGKLSCFPDTSTPPMFHCPHCGNTGSITIETHFDLESDSF